MGEFNEVRKQAEKHGFIFNVQRVEAFNSFISAAGLEEVPLSGCSFTWRHKSATKMSKLDRFLISEVPPLVIRVVDLEKAYDSVCQDYLDDVLKKFSVGDRWCGWIRSCLRSSRGSVIVNGIPIREFQFHRGLKQGDPLSPFLFILIIENFHILVQRVVDAGMFKGISMGPSFHLSHLFYADDVVFMSHWNDSNIETIVQVIECCYRASGLRINMNKSKIMGILVDNIIVNQQQQRLVFSLDAHFSYLGSKMKTLPICGILTLLKSVLGSMPIYHISLFKVPMKVLQRMKSIRFHFFNVVDHNGKKPIWVKWIKVLASKEIGGLGVSSFYVLNKSILCKWVWRFHTQGSLPWARVIKGINGEDGKLCKNVNHSHPSIWLHIVREMKHLKNYGTDLIGFIHKNLANGTNTSFWEDGGIEQVQFLQFLASMEGVADMRDIWVWSLEGSREFSVAYVQRLVDECCMLEVLTKTRCINVVPIIVNVHAWKV
nr:RNA-directed DNA polymerase, eukaryota, reverse transcriptase zinc-binding domain protein [Tanacetum cinerariifolium]